MAQLLTGKEVVAAMAQNLAPRVEALREAGVIPTLAFIRVGDRSDDLSYQRTATKRAESLGVRTVAFELPEDATQDMLETVIAQVNEDDTIHGCLMFRPLPKQLDDTAACDALAVQKDIDGITTRALASLFTGRGEGYPPSTAEACVRILDHYGIDPAGQHVVVVGRSLVVGKPVSMLLLDRQATVTICHSRTKDLAMQMRAADIVICATGRAKAYGVECFAPGQVVLDVGINFVDGQLCGDVHFDTVESLVDAITPVPGGLGSVTTSLTMEHTIHAAELALKRML